MLHPLPFCQKQEALSELFMSYLGLSQMKCRAIIPPQFYWNPHTTQISKNELQFNVSPELQKPHLGAGSCYIVYCKM